MDLIERLMNLKYSYKEAEKIYLEYAENDDLLELEVFIISLEEEQNV